MSRYLIPFWAAAASGEKVTYNKSANTGTIGGVSYSIRKPLLPTVEVVRRQTSVVEGNRVWWWIQATANLTKNLDVLITVSQSGSFISSSDLGDKTVRINSGQRRASFSIPTINDTTDEPDGSVTVALRANSAYTIGSSSSATISITDNDMPVPTTYEEKTSERINLGSGDWAGLWRTSNRWAVTNNDDFPGTSAWTKGLRFFNFAGTEQTSEGFRLRKGEAIFYHGIWRESGIWYMVGANGQLFNFGARRDGLPDPEIDTTLLQGGLFGVWRTSNRWVFVDSQNGRIIFFTHITRGQRVTEQISERINIGSGFWTGLWRTSNRWAIVDNTQNSIRFFNFTGTEQTSEKISLGSGDWGGIWKTDTRWVVVDNTSNRLRFFGLE